MSHFPQDASSKKIPALRTPTLFCRICGKPVSVETAKTDGDGKAIHEECYVLKVKLENATDDAHDGKESATETRPWKVDAEDHALDEQGLDGKPKPRPAAEPKADGK